MRMHIGIEDELVAKVDAAAGPRGRSTLVRRAIEQEARWGSLDAAAGSLRSTEHEWDDDPAEWVRRQRRGDARRGG